MSMIPNISFKNTSIKFSKMWTKILNLESSLFPALKEELRLEELSHKEQKLIKILDFAQIEKNVTVVSRLSLHKGTKSDMRFKSSLILFYDFFRLCLFIQLYRFASVVLYRLAINF